MTFSSVTAKRRNGSANVKGPDVSRQSKRLERRYLDPVTLGIFYTRPCKWILRRARKRHRFFLLTRIIRCQRNDSDAGMMRLDERGRCKAARSLFKY
jgi:hypothetical protein